jgi:hypothetical protein
MLPALSAGTSPLYTPAFWTAYARPHHMLTPQQAEARLRLKRGALSALACEYPEVREAFEAGERAGLDQLRATLRAAEQRFAKSSRRADRRTARELRNLRRAGAF